MITGNTAERAVAYWYAKMHLQQIITTITKIQDNTNYSAAQYETKVDNSNCMYSRGFPLIGIY